MGMGGVQEAEILGTDWGGGHCGDLLGSVHTAVGRSRFSVQF